MSQLSIDARTILAYLNDLGYRNITAEQLKEFMKDLRKLIKYEDRLGTRTDNIPMTIDEKSKNLFEKLYKTTTASYRAKLPDKNINTAADIPAKNILSDDKALNHNKQQKENIYLKSVSANEIKCKTSNRTTAAGYDNSNRKSSGQNIIDSGRSSSKVITSSTDRPSSSKMWIRPKSVPVHKTSFKSKYPQKGDPVQLYQYYKSEWDKFKPYLPGENSHSDLRWEIRNKLLG